MSISEIKRFGADLASDPALCAEVEAYGHAAARSPEDLVSLAAAKGYSFTADDLAKAADEARSRPISDDQLEGVAGGAQEQDVGTMMFAAQFMIGVFSIFMQNHNAKA